MYWARTRSDEDRDFSYSYQRIVILILVCKYSQQKICLWQCLIGWLVLMVIETISYFVLLSLISYDRHKEIILYSDYKKWLQIRG